MRTISRLQVPILCRRLHYWGIAAALAGMGIVGASSLMSGDSGVAKVGSASAWTLALTRAVWRFPAPVAAKVLLSDWRLAAMAGPAAGVKHCSMQLLQHLHGHTTLSAELGWLCIGRRGDASVMEPVCCVKADSTKCLPSS